MAESDLEVRIRVKNEAEGAVEDLKKGIEGVTEAVEETKKAAQELGDTSGAEKLAKDFEKISESLAEFSDADFSAITDGLVALADEAGVTADEFGKFIGLMSDEFEVMAQEALAAKDIAKSVDFSEAAASLENLATAADLGALVDQLGLLAEAETEAGETTKNFSKELQSVTGAEQLVTELDKISTALEGLPEADFSSITKGLVSLADDVGSTSGEFSEALNLMIDRFRELSQEALEAKDLGKSIDFSNAAESLEKLATSADLGPLVEQLRVLITAETEAETTTKSLSEQLGSATGAEKLIEEFDDIAQSLTSLSDVDLSVVNERLVALAREVGVSAGEFDKFLEQIGDRFRDLSQEAADAKDIGKSLDFSEAAESLKKLSTGANFDAMVRQLEELEEAERKTTEATGDLSAELGKTAGAERLVAEFDNISESLANLSNADFSSVVTELATLASEANVTAEDFGKFIDLISDRLEALSQEALSTGDIAKSIDFSTAEEGLRQLATGTDLSGLVGQVESLEAAETAAGAATQGLSEELDKVGTEKLVGEFDKVSDSLSELSDVDFGPVVAGLVALSNEAGVTSGEFDKTHDSLISLSGANFDAVSDSLVSLANQAGVTADNFGEFLGLMADKFDEVSQEALEANDIASTLDFSVAAESLRRLATSTDLGGLVTQLESLETAQTEARETTRSFSEELSKATGAEELAAKVDRVADSLTGLSDVNLESVTNGLVTMANEAGVTADEFSQFLELLSERLSTMAQEALEANDIASSLDFSSAAESLERLTGADLGRLVDELQSLGEAEVTAVSATQDLSQGLADTAGAEKLTEEIEKAAEALRGMAGRGLADQVTIQISDLAQKTGIASTEIVQFVEGVATAFRRMGEEAEAAGRSTAAVDLGKAAAGLDRFIASGDFTRLVSQLEEVEAAGTRAGAATDELAEGMQRAAQAGAGELAEEIGKVSDSTKDFSGEGFAVVVNGLKALAEEAKVSADEFGTFASLIAAELQNMSVEAAAAEDSVNSINFSDASRSLQDFIASADFSDLVEELRRVEQAAQDTAEVGGELQPVTDALVDMEESAERTAGAFTGFDDAKEKFADLADVIKGLSEEEFKAVSEGLSTLVSGAQISAEEFSKLTTLISSELEDLSQDVENTKRATDGLDFSEAARSLKDFIDNADFSSLLRELQDVNTAAEATARLAGQFQPVVDTLIEMAKEASTSAETFDEFNSAVKLFEDLEEELRRVAEEVLKTDSTTAQFLMSLADGLDTAKEKAEELAQTMDGIAPPDTVSALESAVSRVQAARADPEAAEREKQELEDLRKELENFQKSIDPAVAAQAKFAEGQGLLERALNAGLLPMQNYQKGMNHLTTQLHTAQQAQSNMALQTVLNAGNMAASAQNMNTAAQGAQNMGTGMQAAARGAGALSTALASLSALLPPQVKLLLSLAGVLLAIRTGIQEAGQTQQLNAALEALAVNGRVTSEVLKQAVSNMEAFGIAGSAARQAVMQLASADIDLANSAKLASSARDIAIARGEKEEEVLGRLAFAITTLNQRALRNMGIVVKLDDVYEKYEQRTGRVAKTLSTAEKQQALANEVFEQAAKFAGVADKASQSYTAQLNAQQKAFKQAMEDAFTDALPATVEFMKVMTTVIKIIGEFFGLIVKVGKSLGDSFVFKAWIAGLNSIKDGLILLGVTIDSFALDVGLTWSKLWNKLGKVSDQELENITKDVEEQRQKLFEDAKKRAQGEQRPEVVNIAPTVAPPDIKAAVDRLVGSADDGKAALQDLNDAFKDFTGPQKFVKDMSQMQLAIAGAFGKMQTFDDFTKFLSTVGKILGQDTEQFRIFRREANFTENAKILAKMNEEIKGYLDATQKIVGLQKIWVDTLKQAVDHETAIQKFTAEIKEDQTALVALETQQRARVNTLLVAEHNDEIIRINEKYNEQKRQADLFVNDEKERQRRLQLAEKERIEATTTATKTYYDGLRKQQTDYLTQYQDTTRKVIQLEKDKQKITTDGEQLLRELRRDGMSDQEKKEDVIRELLERRTKLQTALATGDKEGAAEQANLIKSLSRTVSGSLGRFDDSGRQRVAEIAKEAIEAEKQLKQQEIDTQKTRQEALSKSLTELGAEIDRVQTQLVTMAANQITAIVKTIVDPDALAAETEKIKQTVGATVAAFQVMADQKSLDAAVASIQGQLAKAKPETAAATDAAALIPVKPDPASLIAFPQEINRTLQTTGTTIPVTPDPASLTTSITVIKEAINVATATFRVLVSPASIEEAIASIKKAIGDVVAEFKVAVDPLSMDSAIASIQDKLSAAKFTITVTPLTEGGGGVGLDIAQAAAGGLVTLQSQQMAAAPGYSAGGIVPGFSPNSTADNILGWLTAKEFVQPVKAVNYYGKQFMEDIRTLRFPKFAAGGFADDSRADRSEMFETGERIELALKLDDKRVGSVFGSRDTVQEFTKFLKKVGAQ